MFWVENEMGLKTALEKLQRYGAQSGGKCSWFRRCSRNWCRGEGFASVGQA